ncbi:glycerophosphoryl diester phosphodiesterase [Breoghania corrubedonensis]|uniref:Glycerophosphoryl diester phosphodiesterase n=1 Tax=Breoghania corrubedonensis TaxID=665038 RepID=A0A2T5VA79_9HYPH|nr:glycerophosphodiester phosphodiesterase family protein [Breoghania corrubedonensis]PTW60644.1 glycerophosphoryl diester phosphodiesterase [Breoghania corrubedonensis]
MTEIVSHRGGAWLWPENSLIAFENTTKLAVEQVEFDVHPSRDGRLVVIHDATLERTTSGAGRVFDHDWADLSQLVLKGANGGRMLLLDEVIEIFAPTAINLRLELKADADGTPYPGLPQKVAETLQRTGMTERTVATSFQLGTVLELGRAGLGDNRLWILAPKVMTDIGGIAGVLDLAQARGITRLGIRQDMLTEANLAEGRARGFHIGCWACNDPAIMRRMFDLDVAVFTTDRPDLALAIRAEMNDEGAAA